MVAKKKAEKKTKPKKALKGKCCDNGNFGQKHECQKGIDKEKIIPHSQRRPYLSIKKTIVHEEYFTIIEPQWAQDVIKQSLRDGDLNIIQHATIESHMWVVDADGKKVATLIKDGACGPDETVEIE